MISVSQSIRIGQEISKLLGFACTLEVKISSSNQTQYNYYVKNTTGNMVAQVTITWYPHCCGLIIFSGLCFHPYYANGKYSQLTQEQKIGLVKIFTALVKMYLVRSQIQYVVAEKSQTSLVGVLTGAGFKVSSDMSVINRNTHNNLLTLYFNVYEQGEDLQEPEKPEDEEIDDLDDLDYDEDDDDDEDEQF